MGLPPFSRSRAYVQGLQPASYRRTALMLEFVTCLIGPTLPRRFITGIHRFGQLHQVLLGVPEIQNALRLGKEGAEEILQPGAAIGDGNLLLRRRPADFQGLAVELATKCLQVVKTR